MKRLLDVENGQSAELTRLGRLLGHVPPIADESDRRQRVRLAMKRPRSASWRPGRVALVLVLLLAAGAAAAAGQRLLRKPSRIVLAPARLVLAPSASTARALSAPIAVSEAAPSPASASEAATPRARPATSASPGVVPALPAKRLATAAPSGDDPGTRLMVEAMHARAAGKYGRALGLLGEYQRRFPNGALQDEALALTVEMTSLQGGGERARSLGRAYLARFPRGRYRAWVTQSLDAAEP